MREGEIFMMEIFKEAIKVYTIWRPVKPYTHYYRTNNKNRSYILKCNSCFLLYWPAPALGTSCLRFSYCPVPAARNKPLTLFLYPSLLAKCVDFVCTLPWQIHIGAAKVAVCCCLLIHRLAKVKHLDDAGWAKVEVAGNEVN